VRGRFLTFFFKKEITRWGYWKKRREKAITCLEKAITSLGKDVIFSIQVTQVNTLYFTFVYFVFNSYFSLRLRLSL